METNIKRPSVTPNRTSYVTPNRTPAGAPNRTAGRVPNHVPNRTSAGKSTREEDRWERDPYPVARQGWSAYKILIVTLLLLAVALGVNYWLRTHGMSVLQNWVQEHLEGWNEEDEMTEKDLSIDWDKAPRVLREEEPEEESVDEPVDEELNNTEEDLSLRILREE